MPAPRVTIQSPRPSVVAASSPAPVSQTKAPSATVNTPRPSVMAVGS